MAKKTESNATAVGLGVGVTAALLSAAGAYFLYGSKNAEKNRKKVKSWTLKAKAEVLEGLERAKDMTKDDYNALIDKSVKTYSKVKGASIDELNSFAREMKSHWKSIEKKGEAPKQVVKGAVKSVKKSIAQVAHSAKKVSAPKKAAKKSS